MAVAVQKRRILKQPLGIILIAFGAALAWVVIPGNPTPLIFLAVAVLFFLGLRDSVWAIAALIVAQLSIPGYFIGPISLRLLLLLLTGILIWRAHAREKIRLGRNAKQIIIPLVILVAVITISNLFNSNLDFTFREFRYYFTGLLIVIFIPAVVKNVRDIQLLGGVAVIVVSMSVIVALYQGAAHSLRVHGISENTLQLSYILGVVFLAILGVLILGGRKRENLRLLFPALLMLPALYLTYTRSALFALFFGLVAMFLFFKTRLRGEIILLVILGLTLFISLSGIIDNFSFSSRSESGQEASSFTRKVLWQVGLAIVMDNPVLGIGGDEYLAISMQYTSNIDPSLLEDRYWTYQTLGIGTMQVHNDFLRMWAYYGTIALLAFLWIFLVIIRNCGESFRTSKRKFIKGLSIGLAAGLISYSINAFYHNVLSDFSLLWLIAGFSLALAKLTAQENSVSQKNNNGMRNYA